MQTLVFVAAILLYCYIYIYTLIDSMIMWLVIIFIIIKLVALGIGKIVFLLWLTEVTKIISKNILYEHQGVLILFSLSSL